MNTKNILTIIFILPFIACSYFKQEEKKEKKIEIVDIYKTQMEKAKEARENWSKRDNFENLEKAINLWEESLLDLPENRRTKIELELSKAYFLYTQFPNSIQKDRDNRELFEKGKNYAYKALLKLVPEFQKNAIYMSQIYQTVKYINIDGFEALKFYTIHHFFHTHQNGIHFLIAYKDDLSALFDRLLELSPTSGDIWCYYALYISLMPSFSENSLKKGEEMFQKSKILLSDSVLPLYWENIALNSASLDNFKKILDSSWKKTPENIILLKKIEEIVNKKSNQGK
ncbi:hypothetical protein JXR93_08365 [bacterium]|nr:hypothetical protein [bacterium]